MYIYLVQNVSGDPRLDPARWPDVMRDLLLDFGGYIGKARDEITDPARIVYRPITSLLLPSPWYVGRVLLIGDAAHTAAPHLASGASIAVEDSIVLAELIGAGKPITTVLEQFMRRRYDRCHMVVENSLQLGEWEKHPNAPDSDPTGLIAQSMQVLAEPA
jgi:2-polyprenyl-6-methoxyphenol hydroxylase-like FAD-dependent oxidoreductase